MYETVSIYINTVHSVFRFFWRWSTGLEHFLKVEDEIMTINVRMIKVTLLFSTIKCHGILTTCENEKH